MAKSLAFEGEPHGIMVNVVAPGGFTRIVDAALPDGDAKDRVRRLAPPDKVSFTYAWLAHESCDVTGEIFGAVGGLTTRIFFAQTQGYLASGPEELRDQRHRVMDEQGYWVPAGCRDDGAHWIERLSSDGG
jgi:hypothetical protein